MKTRNRLLLAATSTVLLAACASMDDDMYASSQTVHSVNDAEYMAAVEEVATGRGVDIVWVNPPEAPVAEDD